MKRLVSLLLVAILFLHALPIAPVHAATTGTCGNLTWTYDSGTLTISGYGPMPDFDTTYANTRAPWYNYNTLVDTIIIKNGVTSIGANAFYNYELVPSINIPVSVRSIGEKAFLFCDLLADAPLPPYLSHIGENAFAFCALKEIILPETLTELSAKAFYYCTKATTLHFGSNLKTIGASAFEGCESVRELTLLQGMNVGGSAFKDSGLVKLTIPDRAEGAKDITLGKYAFDDCRHLEEVYIGDSVTTISDYAFRNCTALKKLTIGGRVSTIGKYAFNGDTALAEVKFPNSLTLIDDFAFMYCTGLKKITMGNRPVTTDQHAFDNCNALEGVYISDLSVWCHSDFYMYGGSPLYYARNLYLDGILVEHLVIPEDVTMLNGSTFDNMSCLKTVVLPPNVHKIGWTEFSGCYNLERIVVLDPNCEIANPQSTSQMGTVKKTVLHGWRDSTLQTYAETYGYTFTTHNESITVLSEPTCTESGERLHHCSVCKHSYTESVAALGHDYTSSSTEPTCTQGSVTTHVCNRCEDTYSTVGKPLDHKYQSEITEPTCTTEGFTTYTCIDCGHSYVDKVMEAFGHPYTAKTTPPTCTEGGFTEYTCSVCGDSYIDDYTEAKGHKYRTKVTQPSCTEGGFTEYTCSVCGDSYIDDHTDPKGHDYIANVIEPTCINGGYTEYTCTVCSDFYFADHTDPKGHDYIANVIEPTCINGGYTEYTCTVCGDFYIADHTNPKGHDYITNVIKPTCIDGGYTEYTCTVCGDSYVSDHTEPSAHNYLPHITKPTCTTDGRIDHICSFCGDCYSEILPAHCPSAHLADVSLSVWYHNAVDYALENGLMKGMSETTFEPDTAMNRAMLVTVLWRYCGEPAEGENSFVDVVSGQWYTNAVAWAAHNGIVGGVGNGRFAPNGNITREQLATILFRYCNANGIDTTARAPLSSFPDGRKVSSYAEDAISWAVSVGLLAGTKIGNQTYLDPQGNATRAQVATILMRFIENMMK
ncbi:MAG: hypothetical protein E7467_03770 [Ruminococcaceae bacterium]|nr:hypothetical protein [Oscillospiraceae bacterium]